MRHNAHRGEISARLDGRDVRLCLTLGALAELETAFGEADMIALATRFENGRLSARDAVRIIAAGLRGAGHEASDGDVAAMQAEGGAAGYVAIVARLLEATFGGPAADGADEPGTREVPGDGGPFAGSPPHGSRGAR